MQCICTLKLSPLTKLLNIGIHKTLYIFGKIIIFFSENMKLFLYTFVLKNQKNKK